MKPLLRGMRRLMRQGTSTILRAGVNSDYHRKAPLVLVNGLAEQAESWFANVNSWRRKFDVHTPNILAYEAAAIHDRIEHKLPIDIDYLVEVILEVWQNRESIRGMRLTYEAPFLRHFTAHLEPVK